MPGRSPADAFSAFIAPLKNALKCIALTHVETTKGGRDQIDVTHGLYLTGRQNEGFLSLKGPAKLEFMGRMMYAIIKDDRPGKGPFRVTTRGYGYTLRKSTKEVIIDYHWHPTGNSDEVRPHIHLGASQLRPDAVITNKQHVLTGRTTFEQAIANAIQMGAEPLRPDWEAVLAATERPHLEHRTWNLDYEAETGHSVSV